MKRIILIAALAVLSGCQTLSSSAEPPEPGQRAYIRFADLHGTIRGWSVDRDGALVIEAAGDHWYRAEMFGSCTSLRFSERLGFITDPLGQVDRFSSVITDQGERCWFSSFAALPARPQTASRMRPLS